MEDQKLQDLLAQIAQQITDIQQNPELAKTQFLTYMDIKKLTNQEDNRTIVAVKAPDDVSLDNSAEEIKKKLFMNNPNNLNENNKDYYNDVFECLDGKHQVYFSSDKGQINVYLIMNNDDKAKQSEKKPGFDPLCSGSPGNASLFNDNRVILSSDSKKNFSKNNFCDLTDGLII